MPSCTPAPPTAPARLTGLATARLTAAGRWDTLASADRDDPAPAGWDDPADWDSSPPDGDAVPPTDEELCGLPPDPYCDPPDGADAWATDIPADLLFQS